MDLQIFSFLLLILASTEAALPLPSFAKKCAMRERAALKACATEQARLVVAAIAAKGDRKYGIAPFDPVLIPRLSVEQPGLFLEFTNVNLYTDPPGSWFVKEADLDVDKRILQFSFTTPALILKANYRIDGRVLTFDIKGSGDCEIRSYNVSGLDYIEYDVVKNEKDGLQYVKLKNIKVDTNITKSTYKFNNLFKGQEALNKAVHDIANENWEVIWADTKDSVMEAFGQVIMSAIQAFLNAVPYKEVFPE